MLHGEDVGEILFLNIWKQFLYLTRDLYLIDENKKN